MEYEEDLVNEEIRSYLSEDELLVYEANIDKIWDEIRNILTIAYNPDDFKADVLLILESTQEMLIMSIR